MDIKLKAYAKINLTLDLTGTLPNNYHGIFTCMQSVGIYDEVCISTGGEGIRLLCSEKYIPCDERNTAYKAAKLFYENAQINPECEIYIRKVIPSGAGLAGGSADAAAVIRGLSLIYPNVLSNKKLFAIAAEVGADVPFCLAGGTRLCQNIGEVMSVLPHFNSFVVIAKPFERVSTKDAYEKFDSAESFTHPDNNSFLYYASKGDYRKALDFAANVFETLCSVKSGDKIKDIMYTNGAYFCSMSGSGSAYYGLFSSYDEAKNCANALKGKTENVFVCKTRNKGVE